MNVEGLYAIIDPEHCDKRDPVWVAERVLHGGCAALQFRAKSMPGRDRLVAARAIALRCREAGVPFWINDHLDLAMLVDADGLHLGQDDIDVSDARTLWGDRPIGLSTHSLAQVRTAARAGADLLGFGPVFETASKANPDPVVGADGLRAACEESELPIVAIGGVTLARAAEVAQTGARFAAAIGAICSAESPREAAATLHAALTGA
jgi:thiamine-phosphate pyrophosphorylase